MNDLFVIVGMPASGKSTLVHEFCELDNSYEYFKNDEICQQVWAMLNVQRFSVADLDRWEKVTRLGNTILTSYWVHLSVILRIRGDVAFAEGYRYYCQDERRALEAAVKDVNEKCKIHYIHLNPPLERRNEFRRRRGLTDITEEQLEKMLSKFGQSFFDFEIQEKEDLERIVSGVVGNRAKTIIVENRIELPDVSDLLQDTRCIDDIRLINRNRLVAYLSGSKTIHRFCKVFRNLKSNTLRLTHSTSYSAGHSSVLLKPGNRKKASSTLAEVGSDGRTQPQL